jgi:trk system potassium uptake protein TrkH
MGISAQTTTGFATIAPDDAGSAGKLLMIVAMFIGGGLGSTAGGIKLLRLLAVLRLTLSMLRRASLPPHALVGESRIGSRKVSDDDLRRVVVLILLYLGLVLLSWSAFLVYDHAPLDSLFEVVSAVGTVGLSTGITNSDLDPVLNVVLGAGMLLGRLEILAFAVQLYPCNWLGKRANRE